MIKGDSRKIGERIEVRSGKEEIVIRISQRIERWQESLLLLWLLAWTFCGGVFLYYTFTAAAFSDRMFFAISSALWLFFFVRILKVFLWRKGGAEVIRLVPGKLTLKNAFWKRGKEESFALHQIFKLGLIRHSPTSFLAFLDDSFWIMGGDKIGFNYSGKRVQFGKQLSAKDADLLLKVISGGIREFSKKTQ